MSYSNPDHGLQLSQRDYSEIQPCFLEKNAEALGRSLELLNAEIRYNTRRHWPEVRRDMGDWQRLNDRSESALVEEISARFKYQTVRGKVPLRYGSERWRICINALLNEREEDPFLAWLESMRDMWDMKPRLDTALVDLFGCKDDTLTKWASRYAFIGSIQRSVYPGCQLREIPILIGKQGIGKSAFCRSIFSKEGIQSGWHSEGPNLTADQKTQAEALQGGVLIELSELRGIGKVEIEAIKSFISKQDDGNVRLAYRRNPEPMPRRCVFVGTTNENECLPNDPSGNTRFVPVICKRGTNVEKYMQENRVQLWAEALVEQGVGATANNDSIKVGDVVSFAGDTNKYVVREAATNAFTTLKIAEPGLRQAVADNAVVTFQGSYQPSVAFNKNAFMLAMRPPALPEGGDSASDEMVFMDPESMLVFRLAQYKQYLQSSFEAQAVWAVKEIAPEHSSLLLG